MCQNGVRRSLPASAPRHWLRPRMRSARRHNKPLRVNRHETRITVARATFDSGSIPLSMNAFGAPPTSCRTLSRRWRRYARMRPSFGNLALFRVISEDEQKRTIEVNKYRFLNECS
jgi:hypothetical protein